MHVTYENLVRCTLLLLLIVGSFTSHTVSPSLTILAFIAFEYMVRKLEKPAPFKDYTLEIKELQAKNAKLEQDFSVIKDNISIAAASGIFKKR